MTTDPLILSGPTLVAATADRCGEAATWCPEENALYWCDVHGARIHRLEAAAGTVTTWDFETPVVALSLTSEPGRLLVALATHLIWWWPATGARQDHGFRLPNWPAARLNDGRADPEGRFWIGSMFNDLGADAAALEAAAPGHLYSISAGGDVTTHLSGIKVSNTLCWSADATRFYFADSPRNLLRVFDYDGAAGRLSNPRPHLAGEPHGIPDGSAIDADGYLWNARWGGHAVVRIAPDGRVDRVIAMPARNITTCAFGGPGLSTLYVTSAANDTTADDRLAGALWSLETAVAGLPGHRVAVGVA